jgi:hypothetical protein
MRLIVLNIIIFLNTGILLYLIMESEIQIIYFYYYNIIIF